MAGQMTERDLHLAVVRWLRLALPKQAIFHHAVNESRGSAAWYALRTRLGMRAGWPDLELLYAGRTYFIELKAPKTGRLSAAQAQLHDDLRKAGFHIAVARSIEDVQAALEGWGVPVKAKVTG